MGWRSVVRSIERAAKQAKREDVRRKKQAHKNQMFALSAEAVSDLEDYFTKLVSFHKTCALTVNWADHQLPQAPKLSSEYEQKVFKAAKEIENFRPGAFDFFFGGTQRRLNRLNNAHIHALSEYERAQQTFNQEHEDWSKLASFIGDVFNGKVAALKQKLFDAQEIFKNASIGTQIQFEIKDSFVHAVPTLHGLEHLPKIRRKQLASGRLSETRMPESQFNELYQDYVCSAAFRIALDVFNTVPIASVLITCEIPLLNKQTGYVENTPILSVHVFRTTLERMNMDRIDPSDALSNFNHVMKFKKSRGFERIEPLQIL
ncbi:hypothetical protein [Ochrobactrum sp. RH2CCR150]|uniref:hypothetical protein n=1 Tax=Ochrobactrum sp. RH2CCR150 TaxID=2587044 RepID=UPI0015F9FF4F|nr:hypothetical protein [Ochrobactrum sp. RH2CCR150]